MSRIEDALRRSGAAGARPVPPPEPAELQKPISSQPSDAHPEESAWSFDDEAVSAAERRSGAAQSGTGLAPGPAPVPTREPRLASFNAVSPSVIEKLVVGDRVPSATVEQYRRLAATLHHTQVERSIRVVMIASALPGEGKTLTATNLALTLSESYRRRVLLIDADLRRPSLHDVFQVPNVSGLSDGLHAPTDHKLSVIQVTPLLSLLTAGRPDADPVAALTSGRMRQILQEAARTFDWVILDTPPVGLLTDANLLAAMVDAALIVVRAAATPLPAVQRAVDTVGRDRVLGVVLNAVEIKAIAAEYGYAYGYGYPTGQSGRNGGQSDR